MLSRRHLISLEFIRVYKLWRLSLVVPAKQAPFYLRSSSLGELSGSASMMLPRTADEIATPDGAEN